MKNKTVLISGGTFGIGKGTVFRLLHDGYDVATFSPDKKKVQLLKQELIGARLPRSLVLLGDVSNEKQVKSVVKKVIQRFGSIDILINNAGVSYFATADTFDTERFHEMVQVNLLGVTLLSKHVIPYMKKHKSGLIMNIVSMSGKRALEQGEFYSATKFGVMGYSDGIRKELKPFGIKVCTVCPGMVKTSFLGKDELVRRKKKYGKDVMTMLGIGDISNTISFICHQSPHCDIQDITMMPF